MRNWVDRQFDRLSGFILLGLGMAGGAVFLALRSGEPAAMVGAAGLMQVAAASTNIALMWPFLPDRNDPDLIVDEDDDDASETGGFEPDDKSSSAAGMPVSSTLAMAMLVLGVCVL